MTKAVEFRALSFFVWFRWLIIEQHERDFQLQATIHHETRHHKTPSYIPNRPSGLA